MICEVCHGDGIIWKRARSGKYEPTGQCPECGGDGMICDVCNGKGTVSRPYIVGVCDVINPCPECHGSGVTNCCRGHQPTDRDNEIEQVRDDQDA